MLTRELGFYVGITTFEPGLATGFGMVGVGYSSGFEGVATLTSFTPSLP